MSERDRFVYSPRSRRYRDTVTGGFVSARDVNLGRHTPGRQERQGEPRLDELFSRRSSAGLRSPVPEATEAEEAGAERSPRSRVIPPPPERSPRSRVIPPPPGGSPQESAREVERPRPEQLWSVHLGEEWTEPVSVYTVCEMADGTWTIMRPFIGGENGDVETLAVEVVSVQGHSETVVFEQVVWPSSPDNAARGRMLPNQTAFFDFCSRPMDTISLDEMVQKCPEAMLAGYLQGRKRTRPSRDENGARRSDAGSHTHGGEQREHPAEAFFRAQTQALEKVSDKLDKITAKEKEDPGEHVFKPDKIEKITELSEPSGKPLADLYRTGRWVNHVKGDMRSALPNDVDKMFDEAKKRVDVSHERLVAAVSTKLMPHTLVMMGGNDGASVSETFDASKLSETSSRLKRFAPSSMWEVQRYGQIDAKVRSKLCKALPQTGRNIADATFGEECTTFCQVIYVAYYQAYSGTEEQKTIAEEEFNLFEKQDGESVYDALHRWKEFLKLMQRWGLRMPKLSDSMKLLEKMIQPRIDKMPREEKDSYRDFMMRANLKVHARTWAEVVGFVDMVRTMISDNLAQEESKRRKAALLTLKDKEPEKGAGKKGKEKGAHSGGAGGGKAGAADNSVAPGAGKDTSKGGGKGDGARSSTKKTVPCWNFHENGTCRFGDSCNFSHEPLAKGVCKDWARNNCSRGDNCRFKHALASEAERPPPKAPQLTDDADRERGASSAAEKRKSKKEKEREKWMKEGMAHAATAMQARAGGGEQREAPQPAQPAPKAAAAPQTNAQQKELKQMSPSVQAYYDELFRFEARVAEKQALSTQKKKDMQGWFAADTAATDVFVNEGNHRGVPKRVVPVGVTDDDEKNLQETSSGEVLSRGTQLMPVGHTCKQDIRSFVWLGGDEEPVYDDLSHEQKEAIRKIVEPNRRLRVVNRIPYIDPDDALDIRKKLEGVYIESVAGTAKGVEEPEGFTALKQGADVEREEKRVADAGAAEGAGGTVEKPPKHTAEMWRKQDLPAGELRDVVDSLDLGGWTHIRIDRNPERMATPYGIHVRPNKVQQKAGWLDKRLTHVYARKEGKLKKISTRRDTLTDPKTKNMKLVDSLKYPIHGETVMITAFELDDDDDSDGESTVTVPVAGPSYYYVGDSAEEDAGITDSPATKWLEAQKAEREVAACVAERKEWAEAVGLVAEKLASEKITSAMCLACGDVFDIAQFDDEPIKPAEPLPRPKKPGGFLSESKEEKETNKRKNARKPKRPVRILPACDWTHEHAVTGLHPKNACDCAYCQSANLLARGHQKVTSSDHILRVSIGGFSVDLMVSWAEVWSYVLVLASVPGAIVEDGKAPTGAKGRKIVVAIRLQEKTAPVIRRALFAALLRAEYVWLANPVQRIKGDREPALIANREWLHSLGIMLNLTEGKNSKDNPVAEEAIAMLARGARRALVQANENGGLTEELKRFLFPLAMEWFAALVSAHSAKEHNVETRVSTDDIIPLLSAVLWRKGTSKPDKVMEWAKDGYYLGPDLEVPGSSLILTLKSDLDVSEDDPETAVAKAGSKIITATTVRQQLNDGKLIWPKKGELSVPNALRGKYRKSEKQKQKEAAKRAANLEPTAPRAAAGEAPKRGRGRPPKAASLGEILVDQLLEDAQRQDLYGNVSESFVAEVLNDLITSEEAVRADQRGEYGRHDVPLEMEVEWEITDKHGHPIDEMPCGNHKECFRAEALFQPSLEEAMFGPREARVTKVLNLGEARKRPGYQAAMSKEVGRFLQFKSWGRPVPRCSVPGHAKIHRAKPIYGVKHWELPEEEQVDKARLIVQGNIRVTKEGKILLEKWFKRKGDYWAPVSSMSGLRLVVSCSVIQELELETIDLDSGYLQTETEQADYYIELDQAIMDSLEEDWQRAIREAAALDPEGKVLFPVHGNIYGDPGAGTSFITAFQAAIVDCGWTRCGGDPAIFYKRSKPSGKIQVLSSYVDDLSAGICRLDQSLWQALRARGWKFEDAKPLSQFLGIHCILAGPRLVYLSQKEYLKHVVEKHEAWTGQTLKPRSTLPTGLPEFEEDTSAASAQTVTNVRGDVGGLMYGGRGTRPDVLRATAEVASYATKPAHHLVFLNQLMSFVKGTLDTVLVFDARTLPRSLSEWQTDVSADAEYRSPKCQTGIFVAISPISAAPSKPNVAAGGEVFLPLAWSTHGHRFSKLSVAEGEVVGAVHGGRAGLQTAVVYGEIALGQSPDIELDELELCQVVRLREDNAACELALKRGYSSQMSYISRIYKVSVAWVGERVSAGELEIQHEATDMMLGDPLTKLVVPAVFFKRKVLLLLVQ